MHTAKSGCRNGDIETDASLRRTTKAYFSKPVIVRHMPVTKEMTTNCTIVARFRQRLTVLSTPVCNNLGGPNIITRVSEAL